MGIIVIDKTKKLSTHIPINKGSGKIDWLSRVHLKDIRSRIITHEGELLTGKKGRNYMDKYSKKYKGRDLADSYRDEDIK